MKIGDFCVFQILKFFAIDGVHGIFDEVADDGDQRIGGKEFAVPRQIGVGGASLDVEFVYPAGFSGRSAATLRFSIRSVIVFTMIPCW